MSTATDIIPVVVKPCSQDDRDYIYDDGHKPSQTTVIVSAIFKIRAINIFNKKAVSVMKKLTTTILLLY